MRDKNGPNLDDNDPGNLSDSEREFSTRSVADWIKKTIATGAPAESFFSLLAQAEKTKRDLAQMVTRELRGYLNNIEIQDILMKLLSNAQLEVHATIRFVPDQKTNKSSIVITNSKVTPKKASKKKKR